MDSSRLGVDVLPGILVDPGRIRALDLAQWDLLIRQANVAGLLPRLAYAIRDADLESQTPDPVRWRISAEIHAAEKHLRDTRLELGYVKEALDGLGVPVCLLKGAAYVGAGLPAARGRVFSDIDFMVPKQALDAVEAAAKRHGWLLTKKSDYDEQYYRRWMHQIPPLRHMLRMSVLDIHHTITPETARFPVNSASLFDRMIPAQDDEFFGVLCPADMVLHNAAHLFLEGETDKALRDLSDLSLLLRHFEAEEGFWRDLGDRAESLSLQCPLYHGLGFLERWFGYTPPAAFRNKVRHWRPTGASGQVLAWSFVRALPPDHASCRQALSGFARWLLYVRGHYLRMPLRLLLPHLVRKAFAAN